MKPNFPLTLTGNNPEPERRTMSLLLDMAMTASSRSNTPTTAKVFLSRRIAAFPGAVGEPRIELSMQADDHNHEGNFRNGARQGGVMKTWRRTTGNDTETKTGAYHRRVRIASHRRRRGLDAHSGCSRGERFYYAAGSVHGEPD